MKKRLIVLAAVALLAAQHGFSQAFIGGSVSFQSLDYTGFVNTDYFTADISPMIGYRFGQVDAGGTVSFSWNGDTEVRTFSIAPFVDYNFFSIEKLSILGRATLRYTNSLDTTYPNNLANNTVRLGASPVVEYRLLDNVAVYASLGELYVYHYWLDSNHSTTSFGLNVRTGLSLGFYVFF